MSYRITMDGQPFCSSNVEHSSVLDPTVSLEVNKAGKLTFTMMPDHPMYDDIELRQSIFDVYQNDELIFEGIATQEDTDFYNRKVISCEGELTFLNDSIQRQAKYTDQTVSSLLAAYLTVHNDQVDVNRQFSLGAVTVSEGSGILRYTNFQSTMKEIGEDLIDNYGGYLRVRHADGLRYLDYLADPPRTSSQVIRLGKNLIDYASNLSSLNIITCLIPRGAKIEGESDVDGLEKRLDIKTVNSGKDYLIGTASSWYGNVWGTKTWDGVTTAAALKTKGEEYLEDVQWSSLVISASAIDLGLMEEDVEQFRLLDMIRVVSEPHGIDREFLLSKLDIKLDHPADTQITLGKETKLTLSARSAKNTTQIQDSETRIIVNASENARQILESSTDGNIYFKYDPVTGKCYEIDIMNTNDPNTATKIWRWNIGGWGYSSDGGQTYTVAATMDGAILASMITTGILKSDDGTTFYLDLDNGVLKGNFSELKISGNAGATQSYVGSEISSYDSSLDQDEIVTKLKNSDNTQGIYISGGKLYIDGEYIKANSIQTNSIAGNSITIAKLATAAQETLSTGSVSVYYRSTTQSTPSISSSTTIGTSATTDNAWEYVMPRPKNGCYFYTCERTSKADGSVSFSTVRQMSNLTYTSLWCSANDATCIDGGSIYANSITTAALAAGAVTADKIDVTDLYAIGATIGGFEIADNSIHTDGVPITSNVSNSVGLSSETFTRTVGGESVSNLKLAIGDKFGVTDDGTLYAQNAQISGENLNIKAIQTGAQSTNAMIVRWVAEHFTEQTGIAPAMIQLRRYDVEQGYGGAAAVTIWYNMVGVSDTNGSSQLWSNLLQFSDSGGTRLSIIPSSSGNITIQPTVVSTWT